MTRTAHRPLLAGRPAGFLNLCGLLLLGFIVSLPTRAAPKLHTFHIEAGDATVTLNEFSRQSSLQLLFDYNIVRGRKTHAISGEYEAPAALAQMLADTGLVFDFVNERTLAITLNGPEEEAGSAVAQAPSRTAGRPRPAQTQSVAHEGSGSSQLSMDLRAPQMQEVTITGTHLRGGEPIGDHLISLNYDDINASGVATVQDFLRTLPQTFGGGPTEDTHFISAETATNSGLGTGINLRGLGARATLVLMNGKRLAPSGTEAAFADIENIPVSAVERIDILPDSASALYGADAVGGVVNFIMKDNFKGAESVVRGGTGTQNTSREYLVAQTLGSRWDSGNGFLSLEYYRRDALPASARRYATSDLLPLGGSNLGSFLSNPGNIIIAGQSYAIPHGQNGTALTPADLVPGQNLSDPYSGTDLLPSQRRISLYASGRQAVNDWFTLFGNALVSQRDAQLQQPGFEQQLQVPSSNPFYVNPTGGTDPVTVDYNFLKDLGPTTNDTLVTNLNVTAGMSFNLSSTWKLSLYGNYAQEKEDQFTGGQVNQVALLAALADPDRSTAFNPFADGSNTNPATLKSIVTGSRFYMRSKLKTGDVTADGPVGQLPGGAIKLAIGGDFRNQVFNTLYPATAIAPESRADLTRKVTAAFGEITVPVFGKDNGGAGYRRLELSVAGRYEHYSDFGQATTPKLGMVWSPIDAVAFRGTWGRSVRAPTLSDLDTRQNILLAGAVPDKSSPTGFSNVLVESGKNASLSVERARSWTTGVDLDAREWVSGLIFSATYFNINFRDRIQTPIPDLNNILSNPLSAYLVTRNPSAAQISSACKQGMLVLSPVSDCAQFPADAIVDFRLRNMESVATQGIDFTTTYERAWAPGSLKLSVDGTYLFRFTQTEGPGSPPEQLLNTQNYPINLKLRGALSWQQRRWGTTIGVNFQNSYRDTLSQPNRPVSSYTTFDTQLRYELDPFSTSFLRNTRLELNAINVFNKTPPFLNNRIASLGYDQENADPTGRLISVQLRKAW